MVFMRAPLFDWLERYRDVIKDRSVRKIQKCVRGYNDRQFVQSMLQSRLLLRSAIASKNVGRAQEILQVVNRRSGKRVAFAHEEREIARLVDEARARENLIMLLKEDQEVWANRQDIRKLMKSGHLDRNDPVFIEGSKAMATIEELDSALRGLEQRPRKPNSSSAFESHCNWAEVAEYLWSILRR